MACAAVVSLGVGLAITDPGNVAAQQLDALSVDIEANGIQDGYQPFPSPGSSFTSASWYFPTALGRNGGVEVTIRAAAEAEHVTWRARQRVEAGPFASMSDLLSDLVFVYSSTTMEVELAGLAEGQYTIRSYHHDTMFDDHGAIDVSVRDAGGVRAIAAGIVQTWGASPSSLAQVQFDFAVEGPGIATVSFSSTPGTGNAIVLNGFDIVRAGVVEVIPMSWGATKAAFFEGAAPLHGSN